MLESIPYQTHPRQIESTNLLHYGQAVKCGVTLRRSVSEEQEEAGDAPECHLHPLHASERRQRRVEGVEPIIGGSRNGTHVKVTPAEMVSVGLSQGAASAICPMTVRQVSMNRVRDVTYRGPRTAPRAAAKLTTACATVGQNNQARSAQASKASPCWKETRTWPPFSWQNLSDHCLSEVIL